MRRQDEAAAISEAKAPAIRNRVVCVHVCVCVCSTCATSLCRPSHAMRRQDEVAAISEAKAPARRYRVVCVCMCVCVQHLRKLVVQAFARDAPPG